MVLLPLDHSGSDIFSTERIPLLLSRFVVLVNVHPQWQLLHRMLPIHRICSMETFKRTFRPSAVGLRSWFPSRVAHKSFYIPKLQISDMSASGHYLDSRKRPRCQQLPQSHLREGAIRYGGALINETCVFHIIAVLEIEISLWDWFLP